MPYEKESYRKAFGQREIDYVRSLGIPERDMHEVIILVCKLGRTPEQAKEMMIEKEGAKCCPHCKKELPFDMKPRYRNRHINRCTKKLRLRSQSQVSEQVQPASPLHSSSPSSSPASTSSPSPNSTASSSSSLSSPSRSPKRKVDDANDLFSGNDDLSTKTNHSNDEERSGASPSAKRPKLFEKSANEPITCKTSFMQQPGTINIDIDRKFVTWHSDDRTGAHPVVIPIANLKNLQRTTAATASKSKGLALKLFAQDLEDLEPTVYLFRFSSTNDGDSEARTIDEALLPFAKAARSREHVEKTTTVNPPVDSTTAVERTPTAPLATPALDPESASDQDMCMTSQGNASTSPNEESEVVVADNVEEDDGLEEEIAAKSAEVEEDEDDEDDEDSSDVRWENTL